MKTVFVVFITFALVAGAGIVLTRSRGNESSFVADIESSNATVNRTDAINETRVPSCGITARTTEGPYYVSGMPELNDGNLNFTDLPGEPLEVYGYVYAGMDNSKPLPGAHVDLWQADGNGQYHPSGNGPASGYPSKQLALRGYVTTDEKGYYEFTTIYPAEYSGRVRHIHAKVRADGYPELTTQLILPAQTEDETGPEEDAISRGLPACHLLAVDASSDPDRAVFDFRLAGE